MLYREAFISDLLILNNRRSSIILTIASLTVHKNYKEIK